MIHNLKELRPGLRGSSEVRVLFVFDPARQAVLLMAGDKAGAWEAWFRENIPQAEQRYAIWIVGGYDEDGCLMARNWKDVRAAAISTGRINEERVAALQRLMLAEVRAHRLAEIRETCGLNQSDIAGRLGVSQSRVSRLERGDMDRTEVATIRAYVGALGGELEIVAKFGDARIRVG